jgi:hypothetical protein
MKNTRKVSTVGSSGDRSMSVSAAIGWIRAQPAWAWTDRLWQPREVIGMLPGGRALQFKSDADPCPQGLLHLGCSGFNGQFYEWLGVDFDVGHGSAPYASQADARADAVRLLSCFPGADRGANGPTSEIRASKSGKGVHLYVMVGEHKLTRRADARMFLDYCLSLCPGVHPDKGPLGSQRFWLWSRKPAEGAHRPL